MKNFLKLTAIFACLVLMFSACNKDDTVDSYIPIFPAIETASVTRGNGKIKVEWTVPDEETLTNTKITWKSDDESGYEIIDVHYGESETFTIGVDDENGEADICLPVGSYTVLIQSMEGAYVGTGEWLSESVTVYNDDTYKDQYPVATIVHDGLDATITWGSFPDDCIGVDIRYTIYDEEGEETSDVYELSLVDEIPESTTLEGAVIDRDVYFTPSFRPTDAIQEASEIITIAESEAVEVAIGDEVKVLPVIRTALGGISQLYVEWTLYQDLDIKKSTLQVVTVEETEGVVDYDDFGDPIEISVYEYTDETKDNTAVKVAYAYISNTDLNSATFVAGEKYSIKITNTYGTSSTVSDAVYSEELYIYDVTTYTNVPTVTDISHDGTDASIQWDLSGLIGAPASIISGDASEDPTAEYNALERIVVKYYTNADNTNLTTVVFTSEDTNHFTLLCDLADAKYTTLYTYDAFYRPEGSIATLEYDDADADTEYVIVASGDTFDNNDIPYPDVATPIGVALRSGYNDDATSYIEVTWKDVDGPLGVANDAIKDVQIFYTEAKNYANLDALLAATEGDVSFESYVADSWKGATPISINTYNGSFSTDILQDGLTITIGKTGDASTGASITTDETYLVAVVAVSESGQFNFTNFNSSNPVSIAYFEDLTKDLVADWTESDNNYAQRSILTYNDATYRDVAHNAKVFEADDSDATSTSYLPTVTRNLTNAIVTWDWDYAESKDIVAVEITEYAKNVSSGGGKGAVDETALGSTTTLPNAYAGADNVSAFKVAYIPSATVYDTSSSTGVVAASTAECGIERVTIEQSTTFDIPYLAIPVPEVALAVGVYDGTATAGTETDGESYINASWTVTDTNSENIGSFKMYYKRVAATNGVYSYVDKTISSDDRAYIYAPAYDSSYTEAPSGDDPSTYNNLVESTGLLFSDDSYSVYVSCVDLDGYERPSIDIDNVEPSASATAATTYNYTTYSSEELKLSAGIEEIAFDGSTMTLTWTDNIETSKPTDCIGVIVTMTSGTRVNQEFGARAILEQQTEVAGVSTGDKFEYVSYHRPSAGETIVPGKVMTQGQLVLDGETEGQALVVPVSTAPTLGSFDTTNGDKIFSTYDDSGLPSMSLQWTFAEENRDNILEETDGKKYMYIYCYDESGAAPVNPLIGSDNPDGWKDTNGIWRVEVLDNVYTYSLDISSSYLDASTSYSIYIGTINVNYVEYYDALFDRVWAYNSASFSSTMLPEITSVASGFNNDIEVKWDLNEADENNFFRNMYIIYDGVQSEGFDSAGGVASVTYKEDLLTLNLRGGFMPDNDQYLEIYDRDYTSKFGVVSYGKEIYIDFESSYNVTLTAYDITFSDEDFKYRIITAKGLAAFADIVNGTSVYAGSEDIVSGGIEEGEWYEYGVLADAVLAADIDLSSIYSSILENSWSPIGVSTVPYAGTFDGNGYKIQNLYLTTASANQGLFGYVSAGTVKNLIMEDAQVLPGSTDCIGAVAGYVATNSVIENCHVTSTSGTGTDAATSKITGSASVGGVVGYSTGATIQGCTSAAYVYGAGANTGGVVGASYGSSVVTHCVNYGYVDGTSGIYNGGVVGLAYNSTTQISTNAGYVCSATTRTGGVVGYAYNGTPKVMHCASTEDAYVYSSSTYVGGIVGEAGGVLLVDGSTTYITTASTYTMQLVTDVTPGGNYNKGGVEGNNQVGGIVGRSAGTPSAGSIGTWNYINYSTNIISTGTSYGAIVGAAYSSSNGYKTESGEYGCWDLSTGYAQQASSLAASPMWNSSTGAMSVNLAWDYEAGTEFITTLRVIVYETEAVEEDEEEDEETEEETEEEEDTDTDEDEEQVQEEDPSTAIVGATVVATLTGSDIANTTSYTVSNYAFETGKTYAVVVVTQNDDQDIVVYTYSDTVTAKMYNGDSYSGADLTTPSATQDGTTITIAWGVLSSELQKVVVTYGGTGEAASGLEISASGLTATTLAYESGYDTFTFTAYFAPTSNSADMVSLEGDTVSIRDINEEPTDLYLGTDGVYTIETYKGLQAFADLVNGSANSLGAKVTDMDTTDEYSFASFETVNSTLSAKLSYDIDVDDLNTSSAWTWTPIGASSDTPYSGAFDGNSKTISNLYINSETIYAGLFGYVSAGGSVKNLILEDVDITSTANNVGAVAGYITGVSLIENCHVTSSEGKRTVDATSKVTGVANTGGVVGYSANSTVGGCTNAAYVVASGDNSGGVVGNNYSSSTIDCCVNYGYVYSSGTYVGGVVGLIYNSTIQCSTNDAPVYGTSSRTGGVAGYAYNTAPKMYYCNNTANGTVTGAGNTGGIIGEAGGVLEMDGASKTSSYTMKLVTDIATPGGNSNYGSVTGTTKVGGIVGCTAISSFAQGTKGIYNYHNYSADVTSSTGATSVGTITGATYSSTAGELVDGTDNAYSCSGVTLNASTTAEEE